MASKRKTHGAAKSPAAAKPVTKLRVEEISPAQVQELQKVNAPFYAASSVTIQSAGNEIQLIFTRPHPLEHKFLGIAQISFAEHVAIINLSPGSAKDLAIALTDTMKNFETQFGTITTPFIKARKAKKAKEANGG